MVVREQEGIMIEKKGDISSCNELADEESVSPPSSIESRLAVTQQELQLTYCQFQSQIQTVFGRLVDALRSREKQLLRQIDVFQSQQMALLRSDQVTGSEGFLSPTSSVHVDLCGEEALLESITNFGKVRTVGCNLAAVDLNSAPYRIEEYQNMKEDHISLYKSLSETTDADDAVRFNVVPRLKQIPHRKSGESNFPSLEIPVLRSISQHSPHVQHWLQQIKAETETEPSVSETEKQFTSLTNHVDLK